MNAAARPRPPRQGSSQQGTSVAMLVGAAWVAAGLAILGWLMLMIYRGSEMDQARLVTLGIPLLMLIGWVGLCLFLGGLAWLIRRR